MHFTSQLDPLTNMLPIKQLKKELTFCPNFFRVVSCSTFCWFSRICQTIMSSSTESVSSRVPSCTVPTRFTVLTLSISLETSPPVVCTIWTRMLKRSLCTLRTVMSCRTGQMFSRTSRCSSHAVVSRWTRMTPCRHTLCTCCVTKCSSRTGGRLHCIFTVISQRTDCIMWCACDATSGAHISRRTIFACVTWCVCVCTSWTFDRLRLVRTLVSQRTFVTLC